MKLSRNAAILVSVALLLPLPVHAEDGTPPPVLTGSYDPDAQQLTLDWTPPSPPPDGSVYRLYRNGVLLLTTTATSSVRDLTYWVEGFRNYTVVLSLPDGQGVLESGGFHVLKNIVLPASCPVASITVYTRPPGASYTIYDECLPA